MQLRGLLAGEDKRAFMAFSRRTRAEVDQPHLEPTLHDRPEFVLGLIRMDVKGVDAPRLGPRHAQLTHLERNGQTFGAAPGKACVLHKEAVVAAALFKGLRPHTPQSWGSGIVLEGERLLRVV